MSKNSNKEKEIKVLERNIFMLGFEVGYFGHSEDYGWVDTVKNKLMDEAKSFGISDKYDEFYEEGKKKGKLKRQQDDAKGSKPTTSTSEAFKVHSSRRKWDTAKRGVERPKFAGPTSLPRFVDIYPAVKMGNKYVIPLFLNI